MALVRALGSLVPYTLHLSVDGLVLGWEDLLGLRFDFLIIIMYVEQEIFMECGDFLVIFMLPPLHSGVSN